MQTSAVAVSQLSQRQATNPYRAERTSNLREMNFSTIHEANGRIATKTATGIIESSFIASKELCCCITS